MAHDLIDLVHDERLDQSEVLRFTIPATSRKAYLIGADRLIRWDTRRFYIAEVEENRQASKATITVEAEALWYRLGDLVYVGSLIVTDETPTAGAQLILAGTDWTVNTDGSSASTDEFSLELQDKSRLEALRQWAKVTGHFLEWNTLDQTVRIVATRGRDLGLGFRYGRNVRGIRRRIQPPLVTVLYPFGRDGLTIAGLNGGEAFIEDFTFYTAQGLTLPEARALYTRTRVWSDTSFVEDAPLLAAAEAKLADLAQGIVTYELDVVDLSGITGIGEDVAPGDTVRVADPLFSTDLRTTVVRYERHPNDPKRNRVELAYLPRLANDATSTTGRPSTTSEWIQFMGPVRSLYQVRNDGDYTVARIPLRFAPGGRANFHLDLRATGVGDGSLHVEVYDSETSAVVFRARDVDYTDGNETQVVITWAADQLAGSHDYRVRVTTTADGGPSATNGVNVAADDTDPVEATFWILAQSAVRETPTAANSERFDFTGAVQTFTVPDGVTEVTIEAHGAQGGTGGGSAIPGRGAMVTASFSVVPGTVYDVYVGGEGDDAGPSPVGGWPNGGDGGSITGNDDGPGGGGSSDVRPTGTTLASALIVAAGGGGTGDASVSNPTPHGGDGGFYFGADGIGLLEDGFGATQFAGGTGNLDGAGDDGSFGQGGDATDSANSFVFGGGGGGGGWYGGEAGPSRQAGNPPGHACSGGGGGSGWLSAEAFDLEFADGENADDGYVIFSWEDPPAA